MGNFSRVRGWAFALVSLVSLTITLNARAQKVGNATQGALVGYTCLGCHGIPNYKNAYPNYKVPKLYGQHAEYIVSALQSYRSGERSHGTMNANASVLTDQDMADVAAWLSGPPKAAVSPMLVALPKPPISAQVCVSCHGTDGVGIAPQYPSLAGQYEDYLVRSLTDYKKGGRKNAIMAGFVAQLSEKDILELAAYYKAQRSVLGTIPKRNSILSAR